MSDKTRQDLASCIIGFEEVCFRHFKQFPGCTLVPSRMNSDVLENVFSQQRGLHNGANTNPNLITYMKTNNSITLGQATVSKKSNGGKTSGADCFCFTTPGPLRPRKRKTSSHYLKTKQLRV
jgi:hypothetical protein